MGLRQLVPEGDQLFSWGAAAVATLLAIFVSRFLLGYVWKCQQLKDVTWIRPWYPLLGSSLHLERDGEAFYQQIVHYTEKFRNVPLVVLWIGPLPSLVLYHPDTVEAVLGSSKHLTKSFPYTFLHPWLGTGLLTSNGTKWRSRRKMLTSTFHFAILADFLEVMNEHANVLVQKLEKHVDKEPFDCFLDITLCALDIICETAMGRNIGAQNNKDSDYVKAVYRMSDLVHHRQKSPWLWPEFLYLMFQEGRDHYKSLKILHHFTDKVIAERACELKKQEQHKSDDISNGEASKPKGRRVFIDMLLTATDEDGKKLSYLDIREEVDTFMFEGHDTTAAAMSWSIYLLACHPEAQRKVHNELDEVFGDSDHHVTADDLKQLRYLECVIKEALRLFPSVPFFGRTLSEDCCIRGFKIPKGIDTLIGVFALHKDPDVFPEPEEFRPERFSPENAAGRHPYAYVPFSAGPRNCIGQRFALMEEKTVLATILRHFSVSSTQRRDQLDPMSELILRPKKGIWTQLKRRSPYGS